MGMHDASQFPHGLTRPWLPLALHLLACAASAMARPVPTPITALGVSPDGATLAAGRPRQVEIHHPGTTQPPEIIPVPIPKVHSLSFTDGGRALWVGGGTPGEAGLILQLEMPGGRERLRIPVEGDVVVGPVFSNATNQTPLLAFAEGPRLRSGPNPGPFTTATGHAGRIAALAWSPDGRWLVSAGTDRSIKVWSPTNNTATRSFNQHTDTPHAIAFQPGANPLTCATAGDDRTVRIWQPGIGRMVRILRNHEGAILDLEYAPDGSVLFTGAADGLVRCFDAGSDTENLRWQASSDWILTLAIHPASRWLATGDASGQLKLWTLDGKPMAR